MHGRVRQNRAGEVVTNVYQLHPLPFLTLWNCDVTSVFKFLHILCNFYVQNNICTRTYKHMLARAHIHCCTHIFTHTNILTTKMVDMIVMLLLSCSIASEFINLFGKVVL